MTLEHHVEVAHRALMLDNAQYKAFCAAIYDEQAVEGSLAADNFMAASLLRDQVIELAGTKLAYIGKALCAILRREQREEEKIHQSLTYALLGPSWFGAYLARKIKDSDCSSQDLLDNCRTALELALTHRALAAKIK